LISDLIENDLQILDIDSYAAIIGESPSKGARSPDLWNACFDDLNISSYFYPFDVLDDGLEELIAYLKEDKIFLGGAVAVPHKEKIIPYLDFVEDEAKLIGAVNLIYRKDGMLCGSNTDGIGAVASVAEFLERTVGTFARDKKVTLMGTGGAAKACAVYFAKCVGTSGHITIIGRDEQKAKLLSEKCGVYSNANFGNFDLLNRELSDSDFIVNCTVVGYENHVKSGNKYFYYEPFTPLGSVVKKGFENDNIKSRKEWLAEHLTDIQSNYSESFSMLKNLKSTLVVMDVVYQPEKTELLTLANRLGLINISGKRMNLLQAAYGFEKAFSNQNISFNNITNIMKKV
jgi:shikimate dehydrogenase